MFQSHTVVRDWIKSQIQSSDLGIRDIVVKVGDGKEKYVMFDHDGLDLLLPLDLESSGTKRLFHLLPQIGMALNSTGTAVLDEIDGDLHVDIAGEILRWFRSRESNPRDAQLFVTSHNAGLLEDLEKEEVFIVEKGGSGATRVHGAQDVRGLRRDARLYAKYRGGVLGGPSEARLTDDAATQPGRAPAGHLHRRRRAERTCLRAASRSLLRRRG